MDIQIIDDNSLGLNRGIYSTATGNVLSDVNCSTLIAEGNAFQITYNVGGYIEGAIKQITSSRSSLLSDNGATLTNATASNYTVTVASNTIAQATMFQQESTGTITLVAGAGVTFIGASLATAGQGGLLTILPTSTANTYIVKLSA